MNYENYSKDLFEPRSDYRKIVLSMFLIKDDKKLIIEVGLSERDINRINLKFKIFLLEQHEEHL